jgi:hypothetical protein
LQLTQKILLFIYNILNDPAGGLVTTGDPTTVFEYFDDFETFTGWTTNGSGVVSQSADRAYAGTNAAYKTTNDDPDGAYKGFGQSFGRDIVLEAWVNRNASYTGGPADRFGILDSSFNGYGWVINHSSDWMGVDVRTNNTGTNTSTGVTRYMDQWVKAELTIDGGGTITSRRYVDGVLNGQFSFSNTAYNSFDRYYIYGGHDYWVDNFSIRKYSSDVEFKLWFTNSCLRFSIRNYS